MVGKPKNAVQQLNRKGLEQLKNLLAVYVNSNLPEDPDLQKGARYVQDHINSTLSVKLYNEDPEARAAGE